MSETVKHFLWAALGIFLILNLCMFLAAMFEWLDKQEVPRDCASRIRRIEYIMPGHRLSCWLGEFVGEK